MKIGYIRVSDKASQLTIRQENIMAELGVEKVFIDKCSGKNTEREELKKMLEYVREGDTVITESISRIARNTKDLLEIVDVLKNKNVQFISRAEAIDTTTPSGKFMLTVFGAVSELEREYILERQQQGIDAMPVDSQGRKVSLRTGRRMGRPDVKYPENWGQVYKDWKAGKLKAVEAMRILNLKKSTFYNLVKKYECRN